jgi:hypothetical protein
MVMVENDVMKSLMKMKTVTGGGTGCDAEYDDEDHHRNITETFYSFAARRRRRWWRWWRRWWRRRRWRENLPLDDKITQGKMVVVLAAGEEEKFGGCPNG